MAHHIVSFFDRSPNMLTMDKRRVMLAQSMRLLLDLASDVDDPLLLGRRGRADPEKAFVSYWRRVPERTDLP